MSSPIVESENMNPNAANTKSSTPVSKKPRLSRNNSHSIPYVEIISRRKPESVKSEETSDSDKMDQISESSFLDQGSSDDKSNGLKRSDRRERLKQEKELRMKEEQERLALEKLQKEEKRRARKLRMQETKAHQEEDVSDEENESESEEEEVKEEEEPRPISEYERRRLENIARNKAILAGLGVVPISRFMPPPEPSKPKSKSKPKKVPKPDPESRVTRKSARIAGVDAQHVRLGINEESTEVVVKKERKRLEGDLMADDVFKGEGAGDFLKGMSEAGTIYHRNGQGEPVLGETDDEVVKSMRDMFSKIHIKHKEDSYKLVPSRIYTAVFHPSADKHLIYVGDKTGTIGLWDVTALSNDADADLKSTIYQFKPHTDSVSSLLFNPSNSNQLFSCSYDSSIRMFDVEKSVFSEIFVAPSKHTFIQSMDIESLNGNPNALWFSTNHGEIGRRDLREPIEKTLYLDLSLKKINTVNLHETSPHYLLTSALDRTCQIFDVRKQNTKRKSVDDEENDEFIPHYHQVWEYAHGKSCNSAYFNKGASLGALKTSIVSTSYDDKIRIWKGIELDHLGEVNVENIPEPIKIYHNNQTGRWVTNFRANWHPNLPCVLVGSKNHSIDIISGTNGELIRSLSDDRVTAIPAVVGVHPNSATQLIVSANASGKCIVWSE
ncbi:WD40-repeat-containing domain protein [Paraphysoderma sedebokerense]|nr:WD40-repeat-containing domain protein [Paraphysoderma sedebokerense]